MYYERMYARTYDRDSFFFLLATLCPMPTVFLAVFCDKRRDFANNFECLTSARRFSFIRTFQAVDNLSPLLTEIFLITLFREIRCRASVI